MIESWLKPDVEIVGPWLPHYLATLNGWEVPHLKIHVIEDGPATTYRLVVGLATFDVERPDLDHAVEMIAEGVAAGMGLVSFPDRHQERAVPMPSIRRLTGLTLGDGDTDE